MYDTPDGILCLYGWKGMGMNSSTHLLKPSPTYSDVFPTRKRVPSVRNAGRRSQGDKAGAWLHAPFAFWPTAWWQIERKWRKEGLL
jgi:hypothetical protein